MTAQTPIADLSAGEPGRLTPTAQVLHALGPVLSSRARRQEELEQERKTSLEAATAAHRDALATADHRAEAALIELDTQSTAERERLDADLAAQVETARARRESELRTFQEGTSDLESRAREQAEEAKWLMDTVGESAQRKANQDYDSAVKAFSARGQDLTRAESTINAQLTKHGLSPLPRAGSAALPEGETRALLDAQLALVTDRLNKVLDASGSMVSRLVFRSRIAPAAEEAGAAIAIARGLIDRGLEEAERTRELALAEVTRLREAEVRKARERLAVAKAKLEQRVKLIGPTLKAQLDNEVRLAKHRREQRLGDFDARVAQRRAEISAVRTAAHADADTRLNIETTRIRAAAQAALTALCDEWTTEGNRLLARAHALAQAAAVETPPWDSVNIVLPATDAGPEPADFIRFGWLRIEAHRMPGGLPDEPTLKLAHDGSFTLPADLDLRGRGSLLIHATPEVRNTAIAALQGVMLRLLTQLPPGKARFTILDPIGLGQSFAGFMHLSDYEPLLVGDRIWTEPRHFEQKLADLTEHMEQVIQKYLRNQFPSIQAYNREAGEIAEPFRFLVIADLPANFTEASAKRLASIVHSGPRCGVFTLICTDTRTRPPAWLPLADIERGSVVIEPRQGAFFIRDPELGRWPLTLEAAPDGQPFSTLVHSIGAAAKDSGRVQVPFAAVAPRSDQLWSRDSSRELAVPIGRAGATKVQQLVLGRGTAQHALIAGRTGSGKSTLLHAIITSLATWYSPAEAEVYLVDFKKGVEFKTYATHELPHARVIAVESEREFGISVLRRLDAELTHRGTIFRDLGVQDLAGFRTATAEGRRPSTGATGLLPRVLLIVDEFQEFFIEDDKLAQEAMLLLDRLVRQGRAFGMHVVLGSQTIGGAYSLARTTIGQMAVRIALQCSESDSYLILSEDNPAARLLSRPGEAIYNDASGLLEGNSPFQVVWLPDDVRDQRLAEVRARAQSAAVTVPPPIVFEGNLPSNLLRNHELRRTLAAGVEARTLPRVWLGEAVSIKEPTAAVFRPQTGSNLLIVGQSERAAHGLLSAAMLALAAWTPREAGSGPVSSVAPASPLLPFITVLDGPSPESISVSPLAELTRRLNQLCPDRPLCRHGGPRSAEEVVGEWWNELERRRRDEHAEHSPRFLLVHGLHRFRALRKSEDDFSFSGAEAAATKPDQQFLQLLRDGPPAGLHIVAWCDTATNLERALDRRGMREFDLRVLFQMSGNDSSTLIDTPAAQNLGANRALLYSEELGTFEKFRPYAPPDDDALTTLLAPFPARPNPNRS